MRRFLGALNKFEFNIKLLLIIQQQQDALPLSDPEERLKCEFPHRIWDQNSSFENEILNTVSLSVDP